jgi:hypothetical protein
LDPMDKPRDVGVENNLFNLRMGRGYGMILSPQNSGLASLGSIVIS